MPQVPQYKGGIRPQAAPGVRVSTDAPIEAFGGNMKAPGAANDLAGQVGKLAEEARDRADHARMLEERRALNEWEYANIYDPNTGAINRRGKDAFGIHTTLRDSYDKFIEDRQKGLAGEKLRQAFGQLVESRRDHVVRWANDHVGKQTAVVEEGEYAAGVESSKERAAATADPKIIATELAVMRQETSIRAHRLGLGENETQQEFQKHESDLHARVIRGMLVNKKHVDASAYFEKVSANMDPDVRADTKVKVEAAMLFGETQVKATELMQKAGGDLGKALEGARKIPDPDLQKHVVSEIKVRDSENEAVKRDRNEKSLHNAFNTIARTKQQVDGATFSEMPPESKRAAEAWLEHVRRGVQPSTEWGDFYALKTQAAFPATREEFLRTNLMLYRPKMADAEFKELVNLQSAMRAGDGKAEALLDGFRSDKQIVDDALAAAGFDPTPKEGSKAVPINEFRRQVDEQIRARQAQTGKKATNEEVQGIVDNLLVQGVTKRGLNVPGLGWLIGDTKKRVFELAPGEKVAVEKKDIPRLEITKIEAALRSRNLPVTDEKVIELYNRKLGLGR